MSRQYLSMERSLLEAVRHAEEADRRFISDLTRAATPLTDAERRLLRDVHLPKKKDYSEHVTLVYDQVGGGCGGCATLAVANILKEMECKYTPDLSMRYLGYVYNETSYHHRDQRFPKQDIAQDGVMVFYGCCTEATWPSSVFAWPDSEPPSDRARDEAMQYRIERLKPEGQPNVGTRSTNDVDPLTLKQALAEYGPLVALSDNHVFAIIGYDDDSSTFTLLNSWGDWWGTGGMFRVPYDEITNPTQLGDLFAVKKVVYVKNSPQSPGTQFTGRVRIHHNQGRKYLVVRVYAEGQDPVVVWDYRMQDSCLNLHFDFPLPDYASSHWPPKTNCIWCVEVSDNSPGSSSQTAAIIEEVVLVKRVKTSTGTWSITEHRPSAPYPSISRGGTVPVYVQA
jgi:hypothetical protein